ncbi:response regulator [Haloarchaeobius sp. HME9146]|uniref:response regulator n=1 Tax=Haloarchaeobius sp. HME9146 TaxID=2978732 RepID=UPI0021C091D9|nr:response regulator [Haloarchaeobius sp. HME9146]MCT9095728.1 response regulator [Haloarchaeobius sp. HME9146]
MPTGRQSPIRVLHVDDDEGFLSLTRRTLTREFDQLTVESTTDPDAALRELDSADCVVSDYRMPAMDGLALFEAVRERDPDLPFVLFTGKGSEDVASEALSTGITDYVRKDASSDQFELLANRIEQAVATAERERELREERERFAALFDNIPEPTVAYELRDGDEPYVTDVNPAFERAFGYPTEDIRDEPLDEFVVPEDCTSEAAFLNEQVAKGEPLDAEVTRLTADGERQFLLRDVPNEHENGTQYGYAIYTDITDQREREQALEASRAQLERQNERLEAFAGVVSHDLRNPLSVATSHADLLAETGEVDRIEHVQDALGRMDELVQDLLALAQHGTAVQQLGLHDLETLAVRGWSSVETRNATLSVECEGAIRADDSRVQQLLENLFRNSVEHGSTDDGALTIRVGFCDGDGFFVADDGEGIPADRRDEVFDHGVSTAPDGSGFGLAIVESIADAHDWTVAVAESESGGARIEVRGVDVVRTARRET